VTGKQNQKMNDITLKIHQFIKDKLGVDESAITNSASFYDELEVDSLDFCELIVDIEKEFDISIPDDMYERLKTVGALVNYVTKNVDVKYPVVSDMNVMTEDRLSA
jgi:acyl carrier protein